MARPQPRPTLFDPSAAPLPVKAKPLRSAPGCRCAAVLTGPLVAAALPGLEPVGAGRTAPEAWTRRPPQHPDVAYWRWIGRVVRESKAYGDGTRHIGIG